MEEAVDPGDLDAEAFLVGEVGLVENWTQGTRRGHPSDCLLEAYLRDVHRRGLLTPEEEQNLTARHAETQDPAIAARLVTANLRLVVKIAFEYRQAYRNIMDLIQEGNIGLMKGVQRFDPGRGVKLSSYAAYWIRAYMLRFILDTARMVKVGTTQAQRKLFFNLGKEKAKLTAMGIEPDAAEIAKRLDVDEKDVIEMDRRLSRRDASLDAPIGDSDGRWSTRLDMMPSPLHGPEQAYERAERDARLNELLQSFRGPLEGKYRTIFDQRMLSDEPLTLEELGAGFGISRERVRQLEAKLSAKLRDELVTTFTDAA